MVHKINPKDSKYIEKLGDNLDGVAFDGSKEFDDALGEIVNGKSIWWKLNRKFRKLLGLPIRATPKK